MRHAGDDGDAARAGDLLGRDAGLARALARRSRRRFELAAVLAVGARLRRARAAAWSGLPGAGSRLRRGGPAHPRAGAARARPCVGDHRVGAGERRGLAAAAWMVRGPSALFDRDTEQLRRELNRVAFLLQSPPPVGDGRPRGQGHRQAGTVRLTIRGASPSRNAAASWSPAHRPHSRDQLGHRKRRHDVVVGARFECGDLCRVARPVRQHDNVGVRQGANAAAEVDSVDVGHIQVEKQELWIVKDCELDSGSAAGGCDNSESLVVQKRAQKLASRFNGFQNECPARCFRAGQVAPLASRSRAAGRAPGACWYRTQAPVTAQPHGYALRSFALARSSRALACPPTRPDRALRRVQSRSARAVNRLAARSTPARRRTPGIRGRAAPAPRWSGGRRRRLTRLSSVVLRALRPLFAARASATAHTHSHHSGDPARWGLPRIAKAFAPAQAGPCTPRGLPDGCRPPWSRAGGRASLTT